MLEDEKEVLELQSYTPSGGDAGLGYTVLGLAFRGFRVITLKLRVEVASDVYVSSSAMFVA